METSYILLSTISPENGKKLATYEIISSGYGGLGLDDVVVTYSDGSALCIQVKHTRAEDTLTFADLVYTAKKISKSLLAELADSWQEESSKYTTDAMRMVKSICTTYLQGMQIMN